MKDIKTKIMNGRERIVDGYEGFYEDENGNLQDAAFHDPILAEGDDWGAAQVSIKVADRLGLKGVAARLREQYPPRKTSL